MKTIEKNSRVAEPCIRTMNGRRVVLLEEAEYCRLLEKADEWEPPMPPPNECGNYPVEALDVLLALKIIRHRRRLGLTQVELARRAGIRLATLERLEQGKHTSSVATVDKIDKALRKAGRRG